MNLWRLYAYSIAQDAEGDYTVLGGGAVRVIDSVGVSLDRALDEAQKARPVRVQLRLATDGSRSHPIRDAALVLGHGSDTEAEAAAARLGERLAGVMDLRSKAGLFVVAVRRVSASDDLREVALWVFPRDTVWRFSTQRQRIEVIEDVFSQTSNQRKLALLSGRGRRAQFATADVLDFQARRGARTVAVFWLDQFLDAVPDMTNEQGSTFVGRILLEASKAVTTPEDRDQIQAAVVALRHSPPAARSIASIGDDYLDGGALEAYKRAAVEAVRDEATRHAHFRLDRDRFAAHVGFRFFRLKEGTAVIAPIDVVDQGTVEVEVARTATGATTRVLHVDDEIVTEQLRRTGA